MSDRFAYFDNAGNPANAAVPPSLRSFVELGEQPALEEKTGGEDGATRTTLCSPLPHGTMRSGEKPTLDETAGGEDGATRTTLCSPLPHETSRSGDQRKSNVEKAATPILSSDGGRNAECDADDDLACSIHAEEKGSTATFQDDSLTLNPNAPLSSVECRGARRLEDDSHNRSELCGVPEPITTTSESSSAPRVSDLAGADDVPSIERPVVEEGEEESPRSSGICAIGENPLLEEDILGVMGLPGQQRAGGRPVRARRDCYSPEGIRKFVEQGAEGSEDECRQQNTAASKTPIPSSLEQPSEVASSAMMSSPWRSVVVDEVEAISSAKSAMITSFDPSSLPMIPEDRDEEERLAEEEKHQKKASRQETVSGDPYPISESSANATTTEQTGYHEGVESESEETSTMSTSDSVYNRVFNDTTCSNETEHLAAFDDSLEYLLLENDSMEKENSDEEADCMENLDDTLGYLLETEKQNTERSDESALEMLDDSLGYLLQESSAAGEASSAHVFVFDTPPASDDEDMCGEAQKE